MFYVCKPMLFEVWEGLGSLLLRVMLLDRFFWSICCGFLGDLLVAGSPSGSTWVSFGDFEGPN